MLRMYRISRYTPALFFPLFESRNELDVDKLNTTPQRPLTGKERLKQMFTKSEFEEISVELNTVVQFTTFGGFLGACLGGLSRSREAYLYFIESNQATAFQSTFDAKKKLQDYVTIAFAKGAFHWGWRIALFTSFFALTSTCMSVYRGESSILDYVVGGTIAGGLYRCNLGLAATVVGAGLGGALSGIAGTVSFVLLKLAGVSMDDIRKALYSLREARQDQFNQALEKTAKIKNDDLTRHHDMLVADKGEKKITEI